MKTQRVYLAVAVTMEDGVPVRAEVDAGGAPWAYCGESAEVWDEAEEEWVDGAEAEIAAAEDFIKTRCGAPRL